MLLVLNLKMNMSKATIWQYEKIIRDKEVIVLPQYPYIPFFTSGKYSLGSQDVSRYSKGSYTGEVCAKGLKDLGVKYVLVGHSERKLYFKEQSADFKQKIENSIASELIPIYCINQNEEEYINDTELTEIENQLEIIPNGTKYIVIAYEPTWMIGNSNMQLNLSHINKVQKKIKEYLMERNINHSIIYGGGITRDNITELKTLECNDGFVISSSALEIEQLNYIYNEIK